MTIKRAEVETLLRMSEEADNEGNTEQAEVLHLAALKIVEAAEKEEKEEKAKKEGRAMSGKAKAKFRAVRKAVDALLDADLDYRGPHKKECRKVETLCEEIQDALAECDFD